MGPPMNTSKVTIRPSSMIFFLTIFLLLLALLCISPADAGLRVVGAKYMEDLAPGAIGVHTMEIKTRTTDDPVDVLIEVMGFGQSMDRNYQPLPAEEDTSPYSARPIITLDVSEFHLAPGESKTVTATVQMPPSGDGGRYALISVHTKPQGEGQFGFVTSVTVPVMITITGSNIIENGTITGIEIVTDAPSQLIPISVKFKNTGNHHYYSAQCKLEIYDVSGNPVSQFTTEPSQSAIIPNNEIGFSTNINKDLPAGSYTVNATVFVDDQMLDESTQSFIVREETGPDCFFTGSPISGPAPLTVQFNDLSTGDPISWQWDFGDGSASPTQHPVHTYTALGNYTVNLTVLSNEYRSASISKSNYISVITPSTPIPPPVKSENLTLSPGWNFISTPRPLASGNNTFAIFSEVDTGGRQILGYSTQTGSWTQKKIIDTFNSMTGIWIYANESATISLNYTTGVAATPPVKTVYAGWNAIGLSDSYATSASNALITIEDVWNILINFNGDSQSYGTSIINGATGSHAETRDMTPKRGYWLYATGTGTLAAISA